MFEVRPEKVSGGKFETSLDKLVSALLAVAEDLVLEEELSGESCLPGPPQVGSSPLAAGPATPLVARSKTPQQGARRPKKEESKGGSGRNV